MSTTQKRQRVVKTHLGLSLNQQCKLLEIHRSGLYYNHKRESLWNLKLMKEIDKYF